jgi:outer membrane receptor protein involved in Fe transport
MPSLKPTLIAICLPFAAWSVACAAPEDRTAVPVAPATQDASAAELQEIVVTGLRASLEKSLDVKRHASVVLDSINAEELGRFPDADVADSLEHLPGITIDRTTGGEGQKVTVRGFGPQYNIVTLNNRILATDDDGRDLAFDVLPSEVISGADVLKSSEASALEGSIGGTVNLRTASPFDNRGFHGDRRLQITTRLRFGTWLHAEPEWRPSHLRQRLQENPNQRDESGLSRSNQRPHGWRDRIDSGGAERFLGRMGQEK